MYRPRPGRHLYRHVAGVVEFDDAAATGTFDPEVDDRPPATGVEDLGGAWVVGPGGRRFEVDDIIATLPMVIESTARPPFGEWEEIDEVDLYDPVQLDEIERKAQTHRENEENSFRIAESMERSALNLIGAYQNVIDRIQFLRFHQAGPGAVLDERDKEKLPKVVREIAVSASISWPHDEFCALLDKVKPVRHRLAHMSWVHSIEGEFPDRVMTVLAVSERGWVDENWSTQSFVMKEIREAEMREALDALWRMRTFVMALSRLISIFEEHADTPPDHLYDREQVFVPWWLKEWGPKPGTHVRADQLRTDRVKPSEGESLHS